MKSCRYCREPVDDRARRCPHCHSDLSLVGKLSLVQPLVSACVAIGGVAWGYYEKHVSKTTKKELVQEQQALATVLDTMPERDLAAKYKTGKSESELQAALKKNPKDIDARIRLRWLQRHRLRGKRTPVAKKSGPRSASKRSPGRGPRNVAAGNRRGE